MAGLSFSDRAPNYLSQRSADVVLSEIRPTKLTTEALRSVNVFLDELLWMILSSARSFSTDQLKTALLKVLPTPLGKEALLEAEVELRAYWDRTAPSTPTPSYVENVQDFPLQPAYELLRIKCEAYSTFNDTDEDTEVESRWQAKLENASGFSSLNKLYIAPAALYLTAIVEHICEHVLSNTGRVTARDSSRSQASLQDLYVALCEDEAIYGLFKNMKGALPCPMLVHAQIEMQSKASAGRPQRAASISRGTGEHSRTPSRSSASVYGSGSMAATNEGHALGSRARLSSESAGSGTNYATMPIGNTRTSTEKSKAKKLFGRTSTDKDGSQFGHGIHADSSHKRTDSIMSTGRRSATPLGDGPGSSPSANEVEFDELMRSGTTMKVSLTPDRLKTFEVYNKEKGIRGGINGIPLPTASKLSQTPIKSSHLAQDSSSSNSPTDDPATEALRDGWTAKSRMVDSIVEDEEAGVYGNGADRSGNGSVPRSRKKSRGPPPVSYDTYEQPITTSSSSRNRSMSASQSSISTSLGSRQAMARKASLGAISPSSSPSTTIPPVSLMPKMSSSISSMTDVGSRRRPSKRDSLDDILDGSSDDDMGQNRLKPKSAAGVTSQTRDLISFLNDGPPEMRFSQSVNLPPQEHRAKQGRFKSMVSRLTRGASSEKLSSSSNDDLNSPTKKLNGVQLPSQAFHPPPLSAKKSLRNISTFAHNQALQQQASYPKPPPPPPVVTPISPPLSPHQTPSNNLADPAPAPAPPPASPARIKQSQPRKAVPVLTTPDYSRRTENIAPAPVPPKKEGSLPSTPVRISAETSKVRTEPKTSFDGSISSSIIQNEAPVHPPTRVSSRESPQPRLSNSSSKHSRRGITPPSSPNMFATHATDLRRLLSRATTADECRLLVDMFLAQSGMPMKPLDPQPDPARQPSEDQQMAVIEALLSNGDAVPEAKVEETLVKGDSEKRSLSSDVSHSLPTPRSIQHSPMTPSFRKPLPSPKHDIQSITMSHAVVSAEA